MFPGTVALNDVSFTIEEGEIHAIVGENGAGKSTLIYLLGGQYKCESGDFFYCGKKVTTMNPRRSLQIGISIVFQELNLCKNLTVVENIFLGNEIKDKLGNPNWKLMKKEAKVLLKTLNTHFPVNQLVSELSIGEKQMVEIAKAISHQSKVIIFDEPTSSLSLKDTEILFQAINNLKQKGITILFISHRMEEVFEISDRITVLRDGKYLGTFKKPETNMDFIVELIAGRKLTKELAKRYVKVASFTEKALEVYGLCRGKDFRDISFTLHKGEILGIYGLQGAGRTELVEALFGIAPADSGKICVREKEAKIKAAYDAIRHRIAMVPEDRKKKGIFPNMDLKENIISAVPDGISIFGILKKRKMVTCAKEYLNKLNIKATGISHRIVNLSGGNQQKVVISKWLAKKPLIFLFDEVTKGIDVGSKAEIFKILQSLRREGMAILLVSSEINEILSECDRTVVMRNGMISAVLEKADMNAQKLLTSAM